MKKTFIFVVIYLAINQLVFAQTLGALDSGFSTDGVLTTDFAGSDGANALAIGANGKIVAVGRIGTNVAVARYYHNGTLDLTFSDDGKQQTAVSTISGNGTAGALSVVIQPDGKIIVAGTTHSTVTTTGNEYFILRYNEDGELDNTFDTDGKIVEGESTSDVFYGVALQPDGKIIAVGSRYTNGNQFSVRRYNANGSTDFSFYGSTFLETNYPLGIARGVVIQADGKIIVAGESNGDFMTIRLNTDGSLDNTFSGDGMVATTVGSGTDYGRSVALQPDGKIVVAGGSYNSGNDDISIVRYHKDGSLDIDFGSNGKLMTPIGSSNDVANTVAVQPDGKIVVSGTTMTNAYSYEVVEIDGTHKIIYVPANNDMVVVEYYSNGSLYQNFDYDGKLIVSSFIEGKYDMANGMILQNDGKIVVAGITNNGTNDDFALLRLHGIYRFDTLENRLYTSFGNYDDKAYDIALDADRKLVVAGYSIVGGRKVMAVARYYKYGRLDESFGGVGKFTLYLGSTSNDAVAYAVAIQSDGKILVAGESSNGTNTDFTVVRLLTNGNLDNTFGSGGKVLIPIKASDNCNAMKLQPDGKIVLSGNSIDASSIKYISVVRLNTNGSLDTSFDGDGKVSIEAGSDGKEANSLAIFSNKIYVGGRTLEPRGFLAIKLNDNGSLDNSFGGDGIVTDNFSILGGALDITIQSDGKVLLAGGIFNRMAVVRYNTNGTLDNSFAGDGEFSIVFDLTAVANVAKSVIVQPDGRILVGGVYAQQFNRGDVTSNFIGLFRLTSNGELDNSFGNDGKYFLPRLGYYDDTLEGMVINAAGRIYISGHYQNGNDADMALAIFEQCKLPKLTLTHPTNDINSVVISPYSAANIEASNWTLSTGKVSYQGSQSVILKPGFKVEKNAVFKAEINKFCSYTSDIDDPT